MTRTHNHFVNRHSTIQPNWPNLGVFIYELNGCGFESCCCHLKLLYYYGRGFWINVNHHKACIKLLQVLIINSFSLIFSTTTFLSLKKEVFFTKLYCQKLQVKRTSLICYGFCRLSSGKHEKLKKKTQTKLAKSRSQAMIHKVNIVNLLG